MKNITRNRVTIFLIVVAVIAALFFLHKRQAGREKVSQFGEYQGYSEAAYDGHERRSEYMMLKDGTRLAYDLILPTKDGVPTGKALPVLFKYTPYLRAFKSRCLSV